MSKDTSSGRAETGARRILVVDDNIDAARMLSLLLRALGPHEVLLAHDGPGALVAARQHQPDVVLLDIGLPGMSGYEVAEGLRQDERVSDSLLVAVTGYGTEADQRRARAAGFDLHLVKPVAVDVLQEVLAHPKLAH